MDTRPIVRMLLARDEDGAHGGPGFYYVNENYPDEGSCGAFSTLLAAVQHADAAGYNAALSPPYWSRSMVQVPMANSPPRPRPPLASDTSLAILAGVAGQLTAASDRIAELLAENELLRGRAEELKESSDPDGPIHRLAVAHAAIDQRDAQLVDARDDQIKITNAISTTAQLARAGDVEIVRLKKHIEELKAENANARAAIVTAEDLVAKRETEREEQRAIVVELRDELERRIDIGKTARNIEAVRAKFESVRTPRDAERDLAITIAVEAAMRNRPTYYVDPFVPDPWVIDAVLCALVFAEDKRRVLDETIRRARDLAEAITRLAKPIRG